MVGDEMIVKKSERIIKDLEACHGGRGSVRAEEVLITPEQTGLRFFHKTHVPPGCSVGEHVHESGRHEWFMVCEGELVFRFNGVDYELSEGDMCIVREGDDHAIENKSQAPAAFYVVGVNT